MSEIFANRAIYSPGRDAVAVVAVSVACNPGQVDAIAAHLRAVTEQAGVYAVDLTSELLAPPKAAEPEPEPVAIKSEVQVLAEVAGTLIEITEQVTSLPEGVSDGEQPVQQAGGDDQGHGLSVGEADAERLPEDVDSAVDGGVAGTSGEVGTGPVGGSA